MDRAFKPFIIVALLVIVLPSCSEKETSERDASEGDVILPLSAFKNVNLIPMTDERTAANQVVLIEGTKIKAIGPSNEVSIPENANIIDGAGMYLMPGLADMHIHTRDDWQSDAWPVFPLKLFLANGVTTIRDLGPNGSPVTYALRWREEIEKGKLDGPTIYASGLRPGHPSSDPGQNPEKIIRQGHTLGFDFLKLYSYVPQDVFHESMTTAKQLGVYVTGHIPYAVGLDGIIAGGMDEIAHVEELAWEFIDFDRNRDLKPAEWLPYLIGAAFQQNTADFNLSVEELTEKHGDALLTVSKKLQAANIRVSTTMIVDDVIVQKLFNPTVFLARPENKYLPQRYLDAFGEGKEKHQVQFRGIEDFALFKHKADKMLLAELHRAKIPLLLSTDAGTDGMGIVPGFSIHDELRILVENGFTPYEAITAGTVNASKAVQAMIGRDDFGTIEVGKRADLILVNGNPLEDVAHIKDLRGVMTAGKWYSKEILEQMITVEAAR